MALPTYTEAVITCTCQDASISGVTLYDGTYTDRTNRVDSISYAEILDHDNADRNELIDDVEAGNVDVYIHDASTGSGGTYWALADVPPELQRLLSAFPFHPTGGWKTPYLFTQNADTEEDSDTGQPKITHQIAIAPEGRKPDGDTYDYPLEDWVVTRLSADEFKLQLEIDASLELDTDTLLNAHAPAKALLAWLETLRDTTESGSTAVGDAIRMGASYENRTFEVTQATGDTDDLEFTYNTLGYTLADAGYTVLLLRFNVESTGADLSIGDLQRTVRNATGNISTTDLLINPPQGNPSAPVQTNELRSESGRIKFVNGVPFLLDLSVDAHEETFALALADDTGIQVPITSLEENASGQYLMPESPMISAIHFGHDVSTDETLRYRDLSEMFKSSGGTYRVHTIHNVHASNTCVVRDQNNDVVTFVNPGQQAKLRLVLDHEGGGELTAEIAPRRVNWNRSHAGVSSMGGTDNREYEETGNNGYLYRVIEWPNNPSYIDIDAFIDNSDNAAQDETGIEDVTDWDIMGSFKLRQTGDMTININYQLRLNPSSTGFIANNNGPALLLRSGDTGTPTQVLENGIGQFSGVDTRASYTLAYRGRHSEDDRLIIMHKYLDTTTVNWSNVRMDRLSVSAHLEPIIRFTY